RVAHRVAGKGAVFGQQLIAISVTVKGRASGVNHARQTIERIIPEGHVRAGGVIYEGEISDRIVGIKRVAPGLAPAIGQLVVSVVLVPQDFNAGLVQLVCHIGKSIEAEFGALTFAVNEIGEVARSVVLVLKQFTVGVGLEGLAPGGVISEKVAGSDLVGVGDKPSGRVSEVLNAAIGLGAGEHSPQQIVAVRDGDAVGVGDINRAVLVVKNAALLGADGIADVGQQALVGVIEIA